MMLRNPPMNSLTAGARAVTTLAASGLLIAALRVSA
jgi:hypothetical protein